MNKTIITINGKSVGQINDVEYSLDPTQVKSGYFSAEKISKEATLSLQDVQISKEFEEWIEQEKANREKKDRIEKLCYLKQKEELS